MNLSTSTIVVADAAVISLSGEVDLATLPLLHDALSKALAHHPGRMLVIDIDGVTVLDDSGLGVLLGAAGSARTVDRASDPQAQQQATVKHPGRRGADHRARNGEGVS